MPTEANNSGKITGWKKVLLVGIGWGLGTALGLAIMVGAFFWYESRPKPPMPPKPWDTTSIKAYYDRTATEHDKNNIVIYYTLENTSAFDYRVEDSHEISMNAKLESQNSLSAFPASGFTKIDYPILVPAKKRVQFAVHIDYPYPEKEKPHASLDERRKYRQGVEKYIIDEMGNLDGFDLLDESNRYEIIFPAGWKHTKE